MTAEKTLTLEEVRARRLQLSEARAKREADLAAKRELELEARALADDEAIAAAEAQHGPSYVYPDDEKQGRKCNVVKTDLGCVIVRSPTAAAWKRFQNGKATDKEFSDLVETCLVHPDKVTFRALLDEQPGVLATIAAAASELAGARIREVMGKA